MVRLAAFTLLVAVVEASNEAVVQLYNTRYRVQALDSGLLRVEQEGPHGFVDNATFLIVDRDWPGVELTADTGTPGTAVLSTRDYVVTLSAPAPPPPTPPAPICSGDAAGGEVGRDAGSPTRTKNQPGKVNGAAACCSACAADDTCSSWVFGSNNPSVQADCWTLADAGSSKAGGNRIFGGSSGSGDYPALDVTIAAPDGQVWYTLSDSLSSVPQKPALPSPAEMAQRSGKSVWALQDAPRFVPPAWGPLPAPSDYKGPFENTSGFDTLNGAPDAYFFVAPPGFGGYTTLREKLLKLTGPVPVLPDFAFGTWFTWYHPYTQEEKTAEIDRWLAEDLPLDVASLDMDWRHHENDTMAREYTVDERLFPDMPGFIKSAHSKGVKVFFNDHPMAWSDQMSPEEITNRFLGLTKILDLGLDFWWFDCHWHNTLPGISVKGSPGSLDYLSWGQYIEQAVERRYNSEHRPGGTEMLLGCSNSDHWSSHRFPVQWTGDNQWTALSTAIEQEITSGLQLKPYVHPDCSGHHGSEDQGNAYPPEVYARWVQFCSLGTILRIHSDPNGHRQPWLFGNETEDVVRAFLKLRRSLSPTLVAAGQRASADGTPLVRRLDLEWPDEPNATRNDQFLLADDTLVAPIDPFANGGKNGSWNRARSIWLPPGTWHDARSGEVLAGNRTIQRDNVTLEEMPMYIRDGALVALASSSGFVLEAWPSTKAEPTARRAGTAAKVLLTHGRSPSVGIGAPLDGGSHSWTVRFHLPAESHVVATWVDGERLSTRDESEWQVLLGKGLPVMPFADGHPASGSVAEVRLPASAKARVVTLELGAAVV